MRFIHWNRYVRARFGRAGTLCSGILLAFLCIGLMAFVPPSPGSPPEPEPQGTSAIGLGRDAFVDQDAEVDYAVSLGGNVSVDGHVLKSVVAVGGSVYLGPRSVVEGHVISVGGMVVEYEGARVGGKASVINTQSLPLLFSWLPKDGADFMDGVASGIRWAALFGFFVLALVVAAVMPKAVGSVSFQVEHHTFRTLFWGGIAAVLVFPVALLLVFTIIGIVLIPFQVILVGCALLLGYIAVAQLIGKRLTIAVKRPNRPIVLETAIGLAVLSLVGLAPFGGWLIKSIATLLGLGGVISAIWPKWGRTRGDSAPDVP